MEVYRPGEVFSFEESDAVPADPDTVISRVYPVDAAIHSNAYSGFNRAQSRREDTHIIVATTKGA